LEYSPALALMQVSALPVLWWAMARSRDGRIAALAAAGAAVAGSILALAGSRVELAIALCVAAACVLGAGLVGARRRASLAAAARTADAGGVGDAIAGSYVAPEVTGGDAPRLLGLAAVVVGAGGLWLLQRRALEAAASRARGTRALAVLAVALPLAGGLVA